MLGNNLHGFFSCVLRRLTTSGAVGSEPKRPSDLRSTKHSIRGYRVAPSRNIFRYAEPPEDIASASFGAFSVSSNIPAAIKRSTNASDAGQGTRVGPDSLRHGFRGRAAAAKYSAGRHREQWLDAVVHCPGVVPLDRAAVERSGSQALELPAGQRRKRQDESEPPRCSKIEHR
jgi:hypothetical protein